MEEKVILIVGASSGIGKSCAIHLLREGYTIFGTSRKVRNWEEISINEGKYVFCQWMLPIVNQSSRESQEL